MIRALLADDQPLMLSALRSILEAHDIEVVGEAANGDDAVALAKRLVPDVVLMDVRMPGRDGIDATAELSATTPGVRVLVLTTFDDDEYLYGALRAGAAGFMVKNSTPEALATAVRAIAGGDAVLDPTVTQRVFARLADRPMHADPRTVDQLTEREKDVFRLITRGLSNHEIADALNVSEATAKTHVSRVLAKLNVRDRVQAVIYGYESGFVS
jgi:DNA-binding NarL/FixJ family response regulator